MFAVIKTGGKQYRVAQGDVITVEKLDAEAGAGVAFDEVLMIGGDTPSVGAPTVAGASDRGEVVEQGRGPKVYTFHKRRRKSSSKRLRGHRQYLTKVRVTEIVTG
jgi:large subunit ribosomal protein L21